MYISPKELDMEKSKRRNLARNPPDHCLVTFERKGKVISIGGIMYPIQIDIDNVAREVFFSQSNSAELCKNGIVGAGKNLRSLVVEME